MSRAAPGTKTRSSSAARVRQAYRGKVLTATSSPASSKTGECDSIAYFEDGLLIVEESGRIAQVAAYDRSLHPGPVHDMRSCVLMPGFVDAHIHYPQTRATGSASGELLEWLTQTVFPEEARFADEGYARVVAQEFIQRMLGFGTTTCSAYSSSLQRATHVLFDELDRAGMRAIAGLTLMDQACPEAIAVPRQRAMAACAELIARWHGRDGGRLSFAVTPRFAPSCSRALMEDAARLASDHDLVIQTHIAECGDEGKEALRAHPYASDYLDIYDQVGLLTPRTLVAHAIHLSASEWDRVAARGARVVHCPDSNAFLGSGRMRLGEAQARGIPVALGSDVAAGRSFDMRRTIASAYDTCVSLGRRPSPEELFTLATAGGARALGLDGVIGTLEPGQEADFIAVRLPDYVQGRRDVLSQIVFAGDLAVVERAFVRGRMVFSRSL
jgi:guanine deaminase